MCLMYFFLIVCYADVYSDKPSKSGYSKPMQPLSANTILTPNISSKFQLS